MASAALAMAAMTFASAASADGIVTCNNCTLQKARTAAINQGLGYVYVRDDAKKLLRFYRVIQDAPGYRIAEPLAVNPTIATIYKDGLSASVQGSNITLPIEVGEPIAGNFFHDHPLEPFEGQNINAFDLATSSAFRNRIGEALMHQLDVENGMANQVSLQLASIVMNAVAFLTGEALTYTIVVTWEDGSKTSFKVTSENLSKAEYIPGSGVDADGNTVPDSALTQDDAMAGYAGVYEFSDSGTLQDWLAAMAMQGVPITGPGGAGDSFRYVCIWDQQTTELRCYRM